MRERGTSGARGQNDKRDTETQGLCEKGADGGPNETANAHDPGHSCDRAPAFANLAVVGNVGLAPNHPGRKAHTRDECGAAHDHKIVRQGEQRSA